MTKEEVEFLISEAENIEGLRLRLSVLAKLNNLCATEVMGWHTLPDDPRRIWRTTDGSQVKVGVGDQQKTLCMHPWVDGVNEDKDVSFNPAINHHKKLFDFRQMLFDHILQKDLNL